MYPFHLFTDCLCDERKTVSPFCKAGTGLCTCKPNYSGPKCDKCAPGFYDYPSCHGNFKILYLGQF